MRVVVQRVSEAQVKVNSEVIGEISQGLLVLIGVEDADDEKDVDWIVSKVVGQRIFPDEDGKMNKSLLDIGGSLLLISQFTLHASTKKGNRPSFMNAARPEVAIPLYELAKKQFSESLGKPIESGAFGADMKVSLVNDGPVTIVMDSKNKE